MLLLLAAMACKGEQKTEKREPARRVEKKTAEDPAEVCQAVQAYGERLAQDPGFGERLFEDCVASKYDEEKRRCVLAAKDVRALATTCSVTIEP